MTTINLAARGLAATMCAAPADTQFLVLLALGEREHWVLDDLLAELPEAIAKKVKRVNGAAEIRLANGTHLVFSRVTRPDQPYRPHFVVLTSEARRSVSERAIDLRPLLAHGAELAIL